MPLRIAVISDLHCHHGGAERTETLLLTDADRSPANQHPIEAALELIRRESLRAEVLLVPGDITNKVDRQGLLTGWSFVHEIGSALEARLVAPTLGNHDVNSRSASEDPFELARRLSPKFPTALLSGFDQFWSRGFCILTIDECDVLIINSVASHNNPESAQRGSVTSSLIAEIEGLVPSLSAARPRVAVCHHHPMLHEDVGTGSADVMINGSVLTDFLARQSFRLLVHGHKHYPKLSYAPGTGTLPVLAAGSFSAAMQSGLATRTRNLFHIIELADDAIPGCRPRGRIFTWQFRTYKGWQPSSWAAADFPHETGFGCVAEVGKLASTIDAAYRSSGTRVMDWVDVTHGIPDIAYLTPYEFKALGENLSKAGYRLTPEPPDHPEYLGKVKQ